MPLEGGHARTAEQDLQPEAPPDAKMQPAFQFVAASNGDRYSVEELKMGGDFQEDCIVLCQAKLSLRVLMEMVTNVSESESL